MPQYGDTISRGIAAVLPTAATVTNKIGTPVASATGTPSRFGNWTLTILSAPDGGKNARVIDEGGSRMRPVKVSGQYTDLIGGLTITLGGTLNHGDMASIVCEREYVVDT